MSIKNTSKIAVIGGGFLGLSLAYYLARDGYKVTVLEKSDTLGGLAGGFKIAGSSLEKYYHHLFKSDYAIQSLLKDLGIEEKLEWLPAKMGIYIKGGLHDFSGPLDLIRFRPLNLLNRVRAGLVTLYLQKFAKIENVTGLTALDWCKKYFGKQVTGVIWEPLLRSKFGAKYDAVSMVWLWARLKDRGSSRPGIFRDEELGYPKGGFETVISALEKELKKLQVTINTKAAILDFKNKGRKHELIWRDRKGNKHMEEYTHMVATVPPKLFLEVFEAPSPYRKQWQKIEFIGAICITLVLKHSFQKYYWTSINDPEAPFVAMVEHTNLVGNSQFQGKHILYLGKYLKTSEELYLATEAEIRTAIIKFLSEVNPEFEADWIEAMYIFKAPEAQHIVTPDYQTPTVETGLKNIYLAHFAQIYPHDRGTNYAVEQAQKLFKLIKRSN